MFQSLKRASGRLALVVLGTLVLANFEIMAQSRNLEANGPLSPIPAKEHPKLIARLNLLVEYQGKKQWCQMYDLSIASINNNESRKAFVDHQQKLEPATSTSMLLSFTPVESIIVDKGKDRGLWEIFGCARYRENGRILDIKARVTAELQNNQWFFSEVGASTQIDGPEELCQLPKL